MEARVASSQSSTQLELAYHQWTVRLNSLPAQPSGYPPVGHSDRSSDLTDYLNLGVRSRAASGTQPMCAGGTDEPWLEVEPPSLVLDSRALKPILLRQAPVVTIKPQLAQPAMPGLTDRSPTRAPARLGV